MRPQWVLQQYIPKVENKKEKPASKHFKSRKRGPNCDSELSVNIRSSAVTLIDRESATTSKGGPMNFEVNIEQELLICY